MPDFLNSTNNIPTGNDNIHTQVEGVVKIIYLLISSVGIAGNCLVIVVILNERKLRNRRVDFLIVHQSVIDLLASLLILGQLGNRSQTETDNQVWDDFVCRLWYSSVILWTCFMASTYNLVLVALDRFFAVVFPILYRNTNTMSGSNRNWTLFCFAVMWILISGFNLMLTSWPTGIHNGICKSMYNYPSEVLRKVSGIAAFCMQYAVPCVFFVLCYVVIIRKLSGKPGYESSAVKVDQGAKNQVVSENIERKRAKQAQAHKNVHITLALVVVCCVTCHTLNQFLFLAFNFGYRLDFTGLPYHISVLLVYTNCCINPIVYSLKYDAFRKATRHLFINRLLGFKHRQNSPENSNQTSGNTPNQPPSSSGQTALEQINLDITNQPVSN